MLTIGPLLWGGGLLLLTAALVLWARWRRVFKLVADFPCRKPTFLMGNLGSPPVRGDIPKHVLLFESTCGMAHLFQKERIYNIWIAWKPMIGLFKPEAVEPLLKSTAAIDKSPDYRMLHPWLGTGLLTSTGDKWKTRRRLLTPAFHFKILEDFLPLINEHSMVLVEKLKACRDKNYVDIFPLTTLCTLDIICETAMGVTLGTQKNGSPEYVRALTELTELFHYRAVQPWLWIDFIYELLPSGRRWRKNLNTLHSFTRKVIQERKINRLQLKKSSSGSNATSNGIDSAKKKLAFLDLLLDYHIENGSLTLEDIREEVDTFMFEGHDTTAVGISWALYTIGLYPAIQKKIHEELDDIFGQNTQRQVTKHDLAAMTYLECVLKESQRLYPSVPIFGREIFQDLEICGRTVPSGSSCFVFVYMLHRDEEVFPNPEVFDPDRFLPENSIGRHPFAYVPFSAGVRNCIGQRFALMEEKTVVANILRHFAVHSLDPRDKVCVTELLTLRPSSEIRLKFTDRCT